MEAKRTPLIELLERVPRDAVLAVEHDQFSSSSHPVGRLCHEAAAALEAARAEVERLADALRELEDCVQRDEALLRQALEALEYYRSGEDYQPTPASEAITAIKDRLK